MEVGQDEVEFPRAEKSESASVEHPRKTNDERRDYGGPLPEIRGSLHWWVLRLILSPGKSF